MMPAESVFDQNAWAAIVGSDVAERTRAVELRDRTIVIETDSSSWSQQVAFLSDRIVRHTQVERVRIRVSPIRSARDVNGEAQ